MSIKTINVSTGTVLISEEHAPVMDTRNDVADRMRHQRNAMLAASDWTQIPDAPVDKVAWAAYRQALRDVPEQTDFPENIQWPEPPVS